MTTAIEHAGFLAAIIEDPHDDFHRIVYADWLEEQGENEQAEFIRAQLELARMRAEALEELKRPGQRTGIPCQHTIGPGGKCALCRDAKTAEWAYLTSPAAFAVTNSIDSIAPVGTMHRPLFRRGFIAEVHGLTFDLWREHGPRLVRQHPLELVKLAGEWLYQESNHHAEWFTNVISLPEWFCRFYESHLPPPILRTREEAEKHLSDMLIAWAKAQELPQGEE